MPGSEPRLHIRNIATSHLLTLADNWKPGTRAGEKERHELFKLEWKEKVGNIATEVMIRTDKHPQKLLDASTMHFEGGSVDPGKKDKPQRWWKLNYLNVTESEVTVLIQSHTSGLYLAENIGGVELINIDGKTRTDENTPDRAKWALTIGGSGLSPGEVAFICITPLVLALGAVTSGAATATFVTALEAASAVTLDAAAAVPASIAMEGEVTVATIAGNEVTLVEEYLGEEMIEVSDIEARSAAPGSKLKPIVVAGAITGAISTATANALYQLLAEVSDKMFVEP